LRIAGVALDIQSMTQQRQNPLSDFKGGVILALKGESAGARAPPASLRKPEISTGLGPRHHRQHSADETGPVADQLTSACPHEWSGSTSHRT
jgi:hypothetical protein